MSVIQDLIPKYIQLVASESVNSELYKWTAIQHFQENWVSDCPDEEFHEMFKKAFAKRENLIFQNSFGFLNSLAKVMPHEAKQLLNYLFQDDIPLEKRLPQYQEKANELLSELKEKSGKNKLNHQQDERTLSFLLTLHNPEKYFLYKDNVYQWLCELNEIKGKEAGQKYFHFCELAKEELSLLKENEEIQQLTKSFIPKDFKFDSTNLIFQDILFRTMPRTKQMRREFFELLVREVKNYIELAEHPLSKHFWTKEEANYRWISIWKTHEIDPYFLHYEIILDKDEVKVELHPEGSQAFKVAFEPFMQEVDSNLHTTLKWHYGLAKNVKGNFHKIVSKTNCCSYKNETEPTSLQIEAVANRLIEFYDTYQTKIDNYLEKIQFPFVPELEPQKMKTPLNQILYGPPGTGKTYSTIDEALRIVDAEFFEAHRMNRTELVSKFNSLNYDATENPDGQIVFTTFHQSMAYEDFIEGIKPSLNSDDISYEIKDGIFKEISDKAKNSTKSNFHEAYTRFIASINENSNDYVVLKTQRGKEYRVNVNSNNNLNLYTSAEIKKQGVLSKDKLHRYFIGENNVFDGWEGYATGVIEYLKLNFQLVTEKVNDNKNYVLIIDEINRGNVSAIFGELITLIEEDKRKGKPNELSVTLPYSKEKFSVPSNLYLIGTMNTADRSVEALDTALRRRFSFTEMLPQPELLSPSAMLTRLMWRYENEEWEDAEYLDKENNLRSFLGQTDEVQWKERIDIWDTKMKDKDSAVLDHFKHFDFNGYDLKRLLKTINERIEVLVDRDHTIGHAFFMNVNSIEDLRSTFAKNIIPLLQEYFYGNYEKMEMVIGPWFFEQEPEKKNINEIFAVANQNFDLPERQLKLKNVAKMPITKFSDAVMRLLDKSYQTQNSDEKN